MLAHMAMASPGPLWHATMAIRLANAANLTKGHTHQHSSAMLRAKH